MKKCLGILAVVGSLTASVAHAAMDTMPFPEIWFKGTVEEAFVKAQKEKKFVFLYWGATWCPPCNSLKSSVFSQPKFKELAKRVVPYYLDGDYEMSQKWGETFDISGYPTILLLNEDKKELLRISTAMNIDEFETAFMSSISSAATILERVEKLLSGKAKDEDWKIVARTYDWREGESKDWDKLKVLRSRLSLYEKMPKNLKEEKLLMEAQLLSHLASLSKEASEEEKKISQSVGKDLFAMLTDMVKDRESAYIIRGNMFYETTELLTWAKSHLKEDQLKAIQEKWINATEDLYKHADLSVGEKFATVYPHIGIHNLENPDSKEYSKDLKALIANRGKEALAGIAGDYFQKHSLLPTLAYYLSHADEYELSKKILMDEMKVSDTPWYYQSGLAGIEERADKPEKSLYWSKMAKDSAKGTSTKLQWIRSDTYRIAKLAKKDRMKMVKNNLKEYYNLAFSLNDGFSGRNGKGFFTFLDTIKDEKEKKEITKEFKKYEVKCGTLKEGLSDQCKDYFSQVLKTKIG